MDILEAASDSDSEEGDVVLCPPDEASLADTDKDSDLSDDGAEGRAEHLPRRLLSARGEFRDRVDEDEDNPNELSSANCGTPSVDTPETAPSTSIPTESEEPKTKKQRVPERKWTSSGRRVGMHVPSFDDLYRPSSTDFLAEHVKSPLDAFKVFITDEVVELILDQSKLYASQKGYNSACMTYENVMTMLGILCATGYVRLPDRRLYWTREPDVYNELISSSMRRNTFEEMLRVLHFADNSKMDGDPFFKMRPIFDICNQNYKILDLPQLLSVDEAMVPYYGRHGTKQYMRGKPVRYGYKLWCLCDTAGYLYHCEPYCGQRTQLLSTGLGQGADVVLGLAEKCDLRPGHCLVFDNFFTGLPLMNALSERGLGGTGTARDNRIGKAHGLTPVERMKKMPRGTTSATFSDDIAVVRWMDNKPVTIVSNVHGSTPLGKCSRWSRQERRRITLDLPASVRAYNEAMGGVDLHDQFSASYRIRIRSKKWWWPLFSSLVRSSAVNAWLLFRRIGHDISQLQFMRQCTQEMLIRYGTERRVPGPAALSVPGAAGDGVRRDGLGHWPKVGPTMKARCKVCGCRTKYICGKCRVALHPEPCMEKYHAMRM